MGDNMYDVIIIGAGPAGLFCAYELIENNPKLKIALIDKGFNYGISYIEFWDNLNLFKLSVK